MTEGVKRFPALPDAGRARDAGQPQRRASCGLARFSLPAFLPVVSASRQRRLFRSCLAWKSPPRDGPAPEAYSFATQKALPSRREGLFCPGIKKGPRHIATAPGIHTVAGRLRQERTRRCSSVLRSGPWDGHRPGTDRERGYLPPGNRSCGSATRWLFHA